jgi:hypothetical protein
MASEQIEIIMAQVRQLSTEDRLKLLNRLKESVNNGDESGEQPDLVSDAPGKSVREATGLVYGKYRDSGRPESTEEDFRLAEWHPTEEELNGH